MCECSFLPKVNMSEAVSELTKWVAIPSVSNPGSPDYNMKHLDEAAEFAVSRLKQLGFDVRTVRIGDSPLYVLANKVVDAAKATLLLYAHYDVQPVDREKWDSDPFTMMEKNGRLYGRGASDDKGGGIAIMSALKAYKDAGMELPVNVKILFEGEEEFGSSHMSSLLKQEGESLKADALVVVDGGNRDLQSGSLTSSTRGLANVLLKVNALQKPVHSGMGCLVPDPAQAIARLVSSLNDPKAIPGFLDDVEQMKTEERTILAKSSQSAESYAKEMGVVEKAELRGDPSVSIYERIVEEPSISIVNMNAGQPNGGNSIQDSASCTIGIRTAPGQDPDRVAECVMNYLRSQPVMYNLPIELKLQKKGSWAWKADLSGTFSKLYLKALSQNFEKACAVPCGGALPLLREFKGRFPDMEMMVPGVEDPETAAHSHNESQDKNLLEKAGNSLIAFLYKAGQVKL
jgi:acetylornithine deacetylase/succinyl-diaminopimelate desuccinylase-like protein